MSQRVTVTIPDAESELYAAIAALAGEKFNGKDSQAVLHMIRQFARMQADQAVLEARIRDLERNERMLDYLADKVEAIERHTTELIEREPIIQQVVTAAQEGAEDAPVPDVEHLDDWFTANGSFGE